MRLPPPTEKQQNRALFFLLCSFLIRARFLLCLLVASIRCLFNNKLVIFWHNTLTVNMSEIITNLVEKDGGSMSGSDMSWQQENAAHRVSFFLFTSVGDEQWFSVAHDICRQHASLLPFLSWSLMTTSSLSTTSSNCRKGKNGTVLSTCRVRSPMSLHLLTPSIARKKQTRRNRDRCCQ